MENSRSTLSQKEVWWDLTTFFLFFFFPHPISILAHSPCLDFPLLLCLLLSLIRHNTCCSTRDALWSCVFALPTLTHTLLPMEKVPVAEVLFSQNNSHTVSHMFSHTAPAAAQVSSSSLGRDYLLDGWNSMCQLFPCAPFLKATSTLGVIFSILGINDETALVHLFRKTLFQPIAILSGH